MLYRSNIANCLKKLYKVKSELLERSEITSDGSHPVAFHTHKRKLTISVLFRCISHWRKRDRETQTCKTPELRDAISKKLVLSLPACLTAYFGSQRLFQSLLEKSSKQAIPLSRKKQQFCHLFTICLVPGFPDANYCIYPCNKCLFNSSQVPSIRQLPRTMHKKHQTEYLVLKSFKSHPREKIYFYKAAQLQGTIVHWRRSILSVTKRGPVQTQWHRGIHKK